MFGYSNNGIKKRAIALGCDTTKAKYRQVAKLANAARLDRES